MDLAVSIDKALRKLRSSLNMPGFRPGQVPLEIVKKRYGKDVEVEEARKFVLDVYENDIVPEHKPVGETQFFDMKWEAGKLEARLKIGVAPEFEIADLSTVTVDKLIHDVTDAEVADEMKRILKKEATWKESDGPIKDDHRVTVDATLLNEQGEPVQGATEEGQVVDLSLDSNKQLRDALVGKKLGHEADVMLGEEGNTDKYRVSVSKIEEFEAAEPDAEFFKKLSNGVASTEDEFRTQLKSEIQSYYDRQSDEMFRNDVRNMVIAAHDFPVPEVVIDMVTNAFFEDYSKRMEGKIPADFDMDNYREVVRPSAIRESRWSFLSEALQNQYPDLELTPQDVDNFLAGEAGRYNLPVEMIKQYYASNSDQLNQLRMTIREQKLFAKLSEEVNINGVDRDTFAARQRERQEAEQKAHGHHHHDHDHDHDHGHDH
jgi:trigger factor